MIIEKEKIADLPNFIEFYHDEHKLLNDTLK